MGWLEPLCAVVVIAVFALWSRRQGLSQTAGPWAAIALAAWIAEQGAIVLYDFYGYDGGWRLVIGRVPLMVALIWPAVVISAGQIASRMTALSPVPRSIWVAGIVLVDASFIEVISVAAGLWHWNHPGYLGVPFTGLFGWCLFGVFCDALVHRGSARWVPAAVPLAVHAGLLVGWWGCLRWLPSPADDWRLSGFVGALAVTAASWAWAKRAQVGLPLELWGPRVLATSVFAFTLAVVPTSPRLWLHVACVALPYSLLCRWRVR